MTADYNGKRIGSFSTEIPSDFKKGGKQQFAYEYIKEKIIKNIYKPQQPLSENELSNEMGGVSRTPIRDALRCLLYEGLVESMPGKGMFVSDLRFEDILEIFEIRVSLHATAARLFVQRASDDDIEMLGETLQSHKKYSHEHNYMIAIEYDNNFHLEIARATRNNRLYNLCQNYLDQTKRASYMTTCDSLRMERSLMEHTSVYEAIVARDEERAVELERAHFEELSKYLAYAQINRFGPGMRSL